MSAYITCYFVFKIIVAAWDDIAGPGNYHRAQRPVTWRRNGFAHPDKRRNQAAAVGQGNVTREVDIDMYFLFLDRFVWNLERALRLQPVLTQSAIGEDGVAITGVS